MIHIRITGNRKNKVEGFYLLLTNGDTYSEEKDEYYINRKQLKILQDNGINHKLNQ